MFALAGVLILPFLIWWLLKPKNNKTLPPGPIKWPLIGNVVEIANADSYYPHLAFTKLAAKYGDVFSCKMGSFDACIITSYEAYKDIFGREETQGRFTFPFVTDRAFDKPIGLIWANGQLWSSQRKFLMKGLREFGFGKMKSMDMVIHEEVSDMITFLKEKSDSNQGILPVNAHDFAGSIVNILWSMVAGYKFPIGDETIHQILAHGNSVSESTSQSCIYNAFPALRFWFPKLTKWDKHMESHRAYQQFVKGMVTKAREQRAQREDTQAQNFIEVFLDEIEKNRDDPYTHFTDDQLVVILQDMFLAGSETTGTAMTWALLFIVNNPAVYSRLLEEIHTTFPSDGPMAIADLKKMVYMKATLYEVYRMGNIAAIPPPRKAMQDFTYNGYTIPKETLLMASMHNILFDPGYWGDPEVFRPERFLDQTQTKIVNTERVCVFGTGKRVCLGESIVWDGMSMYLGQMLKNFQFSAIPGQEPDHLRPLSTGTLNPRPYSLQLKSIN